MSKVDPVAVAKECFIETSTAHIYGPTRWENEAMARVVLAAAEVCSHKDIKRVIIDAHLADDIDALAAALKGGEE